MFKSVHACICVECVHVHLYVCVCVCMCVSFGFRSGFVSSQLNFKEVCVAVVLRAFTLLLNLQWKWRIFTLINNQVCTLVVFTA